MGTVLPILKHVVRNLIVRPDLNGSLTSTCLQKGSKSTTPSEQYVEWILTSTYLHDESKSASLSEQYFEYPPPPLNMLNRVPTSAYLQTGLKSATSSEQYVALAFSRPEIRSGQTLRLQRTCLLSMSLS